jgi:tetratricopeptide (TPR) repeat protein
MPNDPVQNSERIQAALEACRTLPPEQWKGVLEQRLEQGEVRRALAMLEQAERPTEAPSGDPRTAGSADLPRVPGFDLRWLLGTGGMGRVFLARQHAPRREVALKLLRTDLVTAEARDRLLREANLLARLDHPAIARVLAVGVADDVDGVQQPWLAMSLINGCTLSEHLATEPKDDRRCVELILQIAEGVGYAHQQGVIHRDLKPSNVMVDDAGAPHILDFGVARLLEGESAQEATLTRAGELVGTLGFMAPEQMDGHADTRSDIYALGVMLYQALTQRSPFDLEGLSVAAAVRRIAEHEPVALRRYRPDIDRDLEAIVMQAMASSPDQRYATVVQFIDDLRRYLNAEPVQARSSSGIRRALLFARRHRVGVAVASSLLVTVLIGTVVSLHFGVREARARAQAEARSEQLVAINRFIQDMLVAADPDNALGREPTVVDALGEAARMLPLEPDLAPEVRAELHRVIGSTLLNLGRVAESSDQLDRAVALYASNAAKDPSAVLRARLEQHRAQLEAGALDEALDGVRALDRELRAELDDPLLAGEVSAVLGRALLETGRHEEAVALALERVDDAERRLGADHVQTLVLRNFLAVAVGRAGDRQREAEIFEELLDLRRARFGADHPQTLSAMNNLVTAWSNIGRRDDAEVLGREVVERRQRVLGADHPATVISRNNLAALLIQRGALDEAEPMVRAVLSANESRLGALHPNTLTTKNLLAYLLEDKGDLDTAETLYRGILDEVAATGDEGLRLQTLTVSNNLAMLLSRMERHAEAESTLLGLIEESARLQGESHPGHALFEGNLGRVLLAAGKAEAARVPLERSLSILAPALGEEHPRVVLLRDALAEASSLSIGD